MARHCATVRSRPSRAPELSESEVRIAGARRGLALSLARHARRKPNRAKRSEARGTLSERKRGSLRRAPSEAARRPRERKRGSLRRRPPAFYGCAPNVLRLRAGRSTAARRTFGSTLSCGARDRSARLPARDCRLARPTAGAHAGEPRLAYVVTRSHERVVASRSGAHRGPPSTPDGSQRHRCQGATQPARLRGVSAKPTVRDRGSTLDTACPSHGGRAARLPSRASPVPRTARFPAVRWRHRDTKPVCPRGTAGMARHCATVRSRPSRAPELAARGGFLAASDSAKAR